MACTIKSVVLAAGESFTLPPGATLIGATDVNNITSTCTIPEDLEESKCYSLQYAYVEPRDPSQLLETNEYKLTFNMLGSSYVIIDTATDGDSGPTGYLTSTSQITSVIPSGLITVISATTSGVGSGTDRVTSEIIFSTIPSIASTISLRLDGPDIANGYYTYPVETECP